MSGPELSLVRERAESARADALEAMMAQQTEHRAQVAQLARKLAESTRDLDTLPAETAQHLLLAVATFAEQGGMK